MEEISGVESSGKRKGAKAMLASVTHLISTITINVQELLHAEHAYHRL